MDVVKLIIEKVRVEAKVPEKSTPGSANYDVYACTNVKVFPGSTEVIPTGWKMQVSPAFKICFYPRSGLASRGITIPNSPAQIDSDYRDEVGVIIQNKSDKVFVIFPGMRICQMNVEQVNIIEFQEGEVDGNSRGGGFGSTGN